MRFGAIKIFFYIATVICHSSVAYAEEYGFDFNVKNSQQTQQPRAAISEPNTAAASWRLGVGATFLPDFIKGSGELVYGGKAEKSQAEFSGWDKYLLKLGASGQQNAFRFGVNFYSVGQKYEDQFNSEYRDKKGYTGYESWLSWNFNKFQIKNRYSEYWTKKPDQLSTAGWWYEVEASYPLTSSPFTEVSMSYRLGEKSSTDRADYVRLYDGTLNSLKAQFRFSHDYFSSSLEVIQSSSQNNLDDLRGFQQEMIYINSTLFPANPLSFITSYRISSNTDSSIAYKTRLNNQESSLGLIYKPIEFPGNLKFTSAYNNLRSNDGLVDLDIVKFDVRLDLNTRELITGLKTSWTVDLRYKDVNDKINPESNASDWSLNLLWNLPLS